MPRQIREPLHAAGIVGLYQAVQDGCKKAQEWATGCNLSTQEAMKDQLWCVGCETPVRSNRTLIRHKGDHWKEWGCLPDTDSKKRARQEQLDTLYGIPPHHPAFVCCAHCTLWAVEPVF
jgi:hypothetical protein